MKILGFSVGGAVLTIILQYLSRLIKKGKLDTVLSKLPKFLSEALKKYALDDFARVEEAIAYAARFAGLADDVKRAIAAAYLKKVIWKELGIDVPDRYIDFAIGYVFALIKNKKDGAQKRPTPADDFLLSAIAEQATAEVARIAAR